MMSLRARLNLGLSVILAAGFALQWALRTEALPAITEQQMVSRLDQDINDIRESLQLDGKGQITIDLITQLPFYRQMHSGHYFLIVSAGRMIRSPSLGNFALPPITLADGMARRWHASGPGGQPLLVFSRGIYWEGRSVTISIAENLTELNRHVQDIGLLILSLNGATIFMALILQWVFVRNALSPFVFLRRELASIAAEEGAGAQDSSRELLKAQEIRRLVNLVHKRLERSRNAIGNLAHSLKTPLALLMRVADDPTLESHNGVKEAIKKHTETISYLIDGELRRARMAGKGPSTHRFNPQEELEALCKVVKAIYPEKNLKFGIDSPHTVLTLDRFDFMELLGNLVDNAAKWAQTEVMVRLNEKSKYICIEVEDDGAGCDEATMEVLMIRGARLDESKRGHGLGLSIVKDVVDQYHGSIHFDRSKQLGGLLVSVRLRTSV